MLSALILTSTLGFNLHVHLCGSSGTQSISLFDKPDPCGHGQALKPCCKPATKSCCKPTPNKPTKHCLPVGCCKDKIERIALQSDYLVFKLFFKLWEQPAQPCPPVSFDYTYILPQDFKAPSSISSTSHDPPQRWPSGRSLRIWVESWIC